MSFLSLQRELSLVIAGMQALHRREHICSDLPPASASTAWQDEISAAAQDVAAHLEDLRQHQLRCSRAVEDASAATWKPAMPVPSHMKYRGQVELIAVVQDDAAGKGSMAAVCCVSDTHLTLFGGEQLDQTLLVLPLAHLIVEAHATHATVLSIRAPTANTHFAAIDTRIFLQVPSAPARHRWLTVFQTRSVPVEGAFESQLQIASPRRCRGAYALSSYAPLVTWISSTQALEVVATRATPKRVSFRLQHQTARNTSIPDVFQLPYPYARVSKRLAVLAEEEGGDDSSKASVKREVSPLYTWVQRRHGLVSCFKFKTR
jgi:hypothetical protein